MATGIVQLLVGTIERGAPDSWAYGSAVDVLWTVAVYGGATAEEYLYDTQTLPT